MSKVFAAVLCSALCLQAAVAQDLYDTSILRTINITFTESNWEALLRARYAAQTNLIGALTVDGVTYNNVGIRIRGNTSYTALPSGSQKFSLNIEMDAVDPEQELMGYGSLNLNNGFHDPTFCREVLYNNYVAQFMPNMRANHVLVTINGQNWGVYNNVQQFNKTMLSSHFADTTGLRIKCANNPNGPGLRYVGATSNLYSSAYEIKDAGGFADPWAPHIAACNALTNGVVANWQTTIDPVFAVDPSIWSVVFENIFTDDDSYVNKGADFMTYRNPTDGRTYLLQTDANETFTQTTWSPILNFTATTKPFLSRVLSVPELRQRYFAHYRTVLTDLNWASFEPRATALRNQIDAAVQADPKKLYTYANFTNNFTTSQTLSGAGPAGGTVPGLQQFLTQRTTSLLANAELAAQGPVINSVTASDSSPDPSDVVTITASVTPSTSAVSKVELFYRPNPSGTYQRTLMTSSGGGIYTVVLPISATPGQRVAYYVAATSANTYSSLSFSPSHTEWDPLTIAYNFGATGGIRITEFMYSGTTGEFIEFTNRSAAPVDMTGWSLDDDHAHAGAFSLSAFGTLLPGESAVVTEADATAFRTAWNLPATVKVIGGLGSVASGGNNFSRNDEINLYNSAGILSDRLTFGDQTFTGTIRTQNASGVPCLEAVGQDNVSLWRLSVVGDAYASVLATTGEKGSPGAYIAPSCNPCVAPGITSHPAAQTVCIASPVVFSIIPSGSGPLAYQWQIQSPAGVGQFTTLVDGPQAGIATISGSTTSGVTLSGLFPNASAALRCVVTNSCGTATSDAATLTVSCLSKADVAGVGGTPGCDRQLTADDLVYYLDRFFATDLTVADIASLGGDPTADGQISADDLVAFLTAFFAGCN